MPQSLQGRTCCVLLGRSLKSEFGWGAFSLQHPDPSQLSVSQWQWMDGAFYIAFRFVMATALVTWLTCEIPFEIRQLGDKPVSLWFTYATEWAFIILTLTSVGFAAFCIYCRLNKGRMDSVAGARILWFFFIISANSMITTSGIYWVTFWDRDYAYFFKLTSKLKHSIPALLVIIDVFINSLPMRLAHCIYTLVIGIFYGLFTYIYWLSGSAGFNGNGVIYPILNWNRPGLAIGACILALLFCCVVQVLLYVLYFTRTYLSYLVGGRGVQTFRLLSPEGSDEGHLLVQEASDDLENNRSTGTSKFYSSLE